MFDLWQIINWFKKNFTKTDWLVLFLIICVFLLTRFINLTALPIFTDEGIYIHWAKTAWHDATWRFISLTDGKQPLQTWLTIPFLKLFPEQPLFAGRLFSVLTGFTALIGIFSLGFYLFGKQAAKASALLYVFIPYFLFYDRLALSDSAVNASFIWLLLFSIILIKEVRLDIALIYGLIGGVALLTKSSTQMFLLLGVFTPILIISKKPFVKKTFNYYFLFLLVLLISLAIYNVQRLSPYLHYVTEKNATFLMTTSEFWANPFSLLLVNLRTVPLFVFWEMGFIIPLISFFGLLILFKKNIRLALLLSIWLFAPYIVISFISKVIFPRYLIFFGSLLTLLATYFFITYKKGALRWLIFIILVINILYIDSTILFNQTKIPYPPIDRGQYIVGLTAGWGIEDVLQFARDKSKEKPVIILAEGNFGLVGDMLEASLRRSDTISIRGFWPLDKKELIEAQKDLKNNYVYVLFAHRQEFPTDWPIKLIKRYPKPDSNIAFYFFEISNE